MVEDPQVLTRPGDRRLPVLHLPLHHRRIFLDRTVHRRLLGSSQLHPAALQCHHLQAPSRLLLLADMARHLLEGSSEGPNKVSAAVHVADELNINQLSIHVSSSLIIFLLHPRFKDGSISVPACHCS
ncbi:hypothetical protein OPV22_005102 [Ensete ventricosum]|uniref:Uncharacterized protein n=1 Tax=Ensete ventricosum TaxID=4639 RepID=A0AAV8RHQ4_ENSVE|nr:hypothetical protein OPV22_005102 [Ensete ventricosum]